MTTKRNPTPEPGDNLMRHLSGWRIAKDTETGETVFFNDLTMNRHCYNTADVYTISCQADIRDMLASNEVTQ